MNLLLRLCLLLLALGELTAAALCVAVACVLPTWGVITSASLAVAIATYGVREAAAAWRALR